VATLLWVVTLGLWPLTVACAAQALTIAIVLTIGVLAFGESMTTMQYIGAAIILAGLAVLATGKRSTSHTVICPKLQLSAIPKQIEVGATPAAFN
jgi:drug/metabolite transporter (DMT)-like permease